MSNVFPPDSAFSCYALQGVTRAADLQVLDLGGGVSAHGGFPLAEFPDSWSARVGEVVADRLQACNLAVLAHAPSAELRDLKARARLPKTVAGFTLTSLLLQGVPGYQRPITHLQGISDGVGEVFVNTVGTTPAVFQTRGAPDVEVSVRQLERARALAAVLSEIHADAQNYRRLKSGFRAIRRALEEYEPDDRIHQLVRAIEAITKASKARQFASRCARLVDGPESTFRQIYRLRNEVEHLDDYLLDFEELSMDHREWTGRLRTYQAERVAGMLYAEILLMPERLACFTDEEAIKRFWAGDGAWGPEVLGTLNSLTDGFEPEPAD